MSNLPPSVLIGAAIAGLLWLATLILCVASFNSRGPRAVKLAVVALGLSLLGATILSARLGRKMSSTDHLPGGQTVVRSTGWQIDSQWFFAVSCVISAVATAIALKGRPTAREAVIPGL